jgi:hypothetical protein
MGVTGGGDANFFDDSMSMDQKSMGVTGEVTQTFFGSIDIESTKSLRQRESGRWTQKKFASGVVDGPKKVCVTWFIDRRPKKVGVTWSIEVEFASALYY